MAQAGAPAGKATAGLDAKTRDMLSTQVALDRAGFSPGAIDGSGGANTDRALTAYRQAKNGAPAPTEPLSTYTITAEDVAGPFVEKIPADMMEKSKLSALGYSSMLELLAERFHASPKLLQRLNPQAKWTQGDVITVPNVEPFMAPGSKTAKPAAATAKPAAGATAKPATAGNVVVVSDKSKSLIVQTAGGEVIFHAPVTTGSENDPLPVGEWKVNGVSANPTFNYNPKLFWDGDPTHAKAKIPAGPNNPVGVVWIDLSKEHYGIHGTPEPTRIGYTESHGCIRLTNWDAMRVAALVGPGTKVILK